MDFSRALSQIADIHQQLAKGEVYRGYRSLPVAASGLIGFGAAWLQPPVLGARDPVTFVVYWSAVAACAAFVGGSEIIYNYVVHEDRAARRRTRQVVGQFMPGLLAGTIVTVTFVRRSAALVPLLPGLWAICFGIGIFASRPYLPRAAGWIALFYFVAGTALLAIPAADGQLHGWWVGATFGTGQLLAAVVLYWNLERSEPEGERFEESDGEKDED
jgi:uncharacterized membrane protein HdeD (DUF308 family)